MYNRKRGEMITIIYKKVEMYTRKWGNNNNIAVDKQ